jgi:hypothetical protein
VNHSASQTATYFFNSLLGDQLETFRSAVDFELFRPELNAAFPQTTAPTTYSRRRGHIAMHESDGVEKEF